jgi:hypothetical protein
MPPWWFCNAFFREYVLGQGRLRPGDPALKQELWIRPLTNVKHFPNGRIHHSALGGRNAISHPIRRSATWQAEISGRLRSRAGSIEAVKSAAIKLAKRQRAEIEKRQVAGFDPTDIRFVAIAYARVGDLRNPQVDFGCDVLFDPTCRDGAHANLVIFDQPPEYLKQASVKRRLVELWSVLPVDQVENLPDT